MPELRRPVDVTVVIPSFNNGHTLVLTLDSLARQTLAAGRFEVVVVLDGSTDDSRERLAGLRLPYHLEAIWQTNTGRAGALNRGVEAARGEILVVIDADILVGPGFLEAHLEGQEDGDVVLGPIPLAEEHSPASFVTEGVRRWADEHDAHMRRRSGDVRETEVQGANYSIATANYRRLGGNRTDLRRAEDYQFGRKLVDAGLRIVYHPEAVAAQIYDKTVPELLRDFYVDGQSQVRLIEEFPEMKPALLIGRYHPMTLTKRVVRPLVVHRRAPGELLVGALTAALEAARRLGLRWRLLSSFQGVIADSLYFRGVRDALGDRERFDELIRSA